MIRIGGSKERIETLSDQLRRDGILLGPPGDALQYLTLMAEFEYGFGSRERTAANELAKAVETLRTQFDQSRTFNRPTLGTGDDPRTLRQEIWALMAHAFYHDYCGGEVVSAIKTLEALKRVVDYKLIPLENRARRRRARREKTEPRKYEARGTRERLCELLAQCLRTKRHFEEARNQFLEALKHTQERLREKRETAENLEAEQAFATISTARLLGGLGRLAILRGQLRDALQMLRSARTILDSVQNDALKGVIDSQILIAERRRLKPGEDPWKCLIEELVEAWKRFKRQGDHDGQRRCCYELGQAYVELAELLPASERREALLSADIWIAQLEGISEESDVVNRDAELYRAHVLRAFRHLLVQDESDGASEHSRLAKESVRQAKKLASSYRMELALSRVELASIQMDLAGCDCIDIRLVEGFELLALGQRRAVAHFMKVRRKAAAEDDADLELEAGIRAAQAEFACGNLEAARMHLQRSAQASVRVENGFLKALFQKTAQHIKSRPYFEFPLEGWDADTKNAEAYYLNWAMATGKTKTEAAKLLGIDLPRLNKLLKSHGIEKRA
jgi:hypothetical protein